MKRYHYFVFFLTDVGYGNVEITVKELITKMEQIKAMERHIEERHNRKNAMIVNWKLLYVEKIEETES